jgi:Homeodomain-like domain
MAFKKTCRVEERICMFRDWDTGAFTATELAARYGVSRTTFTDWHRRCESGAADWYEEHSRAPLVCTHATGAKHVAAIVALCAKFPHFGLKKLCAKLMSSRPGMSQRPRRLAIS